MGLHVNYGDSILISDPDSGLDKYLHRHLLHARRLMTRPVFRLIPPDRVAAPWVLIMCWAVISLPYRGRKVPKLESGKPFQE